MNSNRNSNKAEFNGTSEAKKLNGTNKVKKIKEMNEIEKRNGMNEIKKDLTVNRLPVATWNHLKVNESTIDMNEPVRHRQPAVDGAVLTGRTLSQEQDFADLNTGMGTEVEQLLDQYQIPWMQLQGSGQKSEEPVVLHYHYTEQGSYGDRLLIRAQEQQRLRVVLIFDSLQELQGTCIHSVKALVGADAHVQICIIQMLGASFRGLFDFGGSCEENGSLELLQLQLGGRKIYAGGYGSLIGLGSHFKVQVGYFGKNDQSFDFNFVAGHRGKRTKSDMKAVGVLDDRARKIFRGTIDFVRGSAKAKGTETEDVLLLGEDVINQSVPVILCGEEDVDGTHGATIGRLDEQTLYYMASRGISEEEAKRLLAGSRIRAICEELPTEELKRLVSGYMGEEDEEF